MRTSFIQCLSFLALLSSVTALPTADAEPVEAGVEARDNTGPGILLTNKSGKQETYYFYNNFWNGDGTAGANFDHPNNPPTVLAAGATKFVPLSTSFKGRVQRGNTLPATWVEFQTKATDGHAHGDVSLEQGCDGAATITPVAGGTETGGFTNDVVSGAPAAALKKKPDGSKAIASTMGNWSGPANQAAITYLEKVVGQKKAYITGGTGVPDIMSTNNQFKVVFY
jgi:hypothetical protein